MTYIRQKLLKAKEFTANGSWTAPSGVTEVWVTACAAGGGGGYQERV